MPFSLDSLAEALKNELDKITHADWLGTLITVVIALLITAAVSLILTRLLKRFLCMSKNPFPSSTIFINILRVTVWTIGICVILSSCFNVNISAAMTALGVGGIAISLGFQATLSNVIGGLQISLSKVVEPGEYIKVGSNQGIVHDITWRHTAIVDARGDRILIPNSIINSTALVKMHNQNDIRLDVFIKRTDEALSDVEEKVKRAVDDAVSRVTLLMNPSEIFLFGVNDEGYKGVLYFTVGVGIRVKEAKEAAENAIAPWGHKISSSKNKKSDEPVMLELFQQTAGRKKGRDSKEKPKTEHEKRTVSTKEATQPEKKQEKNERGA